MATKNDIVGWFAALRERLDNVAGADLPEAEREQVKMLVGLGLCIAETLVTDINRIANSAEAGLDKS